MTGLGLPVLVMLTSALVVTVVVAVELLLRPFGSDVVEPAVAVLVIVEPLAVSALTVVLMTMMWEPVAARVAKLVEPVHGLLAPPSIVNVAPLASWLGSVSVTTTDWASDGPALDTARL